LKEDKRSENRYPTNDEVRVKLTRFPEIKQDGKVHNVSRSGLQLEVPLAVQIHSEVEVLLSGGAALFGEVCYCRRVGAVFHAGIRIHDAVFSSTTEHSSRESLSLYAAGRGLTAFEALKIIMHLEQCPQCSAALDEASDFLRRARRAWGKLPDDQ
jgi:PilZ domain-containing protein